MMFLDKIDMKQAHKDCLRKTPFNKFFEPFIKKNVWSTYLKGMQGTGRNSNGI